MAIDPNKVVQWFREYETGMQGRSDYDVYEYAKGAYPQYKKELEEVGNPFDPEPVQPIITDKSEEEADYSPSKIEGLTSMLNTANMFADEGMPSLGLKPEFFKKAYNESLAGMTYAISNGKFKYDIGDYEPSMMEEVGQFVVGTLNPIDIVAFFGLPIGGAAIGTKIAQKQLAKWGTKAIADGARKKVVQDNLKSSIYEGILQTGLGFGAYSSAAGAISSASQQATDPEGDGKIDGWKVAKDATASGLEGIFMGAAAGGASKAIGNRYAKWSIANKDASTLEKSTRKTLNVLGQMGVEAGAFTAIPYFIHGVPKDEDGTIGWEQVGKQLIADFALDAVIRVSTGDVFRQANQDLKQYSNSLSREINSKIESSDELSQSIRNIVEDNPEAASVFREEKTKELNKIIGIKDGVDKLLKDTNRALELSNKAEAELTDSERMELISYVKSMNEIKGLYLETLEQPELQKQLGIELMSPDTETLLISRIKAIDNANKKINKLKTVEAEAPKTDVGEPVKTDTKRKDLSEMTDIELIDEASRTTGRTQEDLRKEYTEDKLDIMKGKKIPTLNRERLMNLLVEPVDMASIKTPDELVEFYKNTTDELKNKSIEIANALDRQKIKYSPTETSKINESHYDIQEISVNKLVNRDVKKGARSATGALVDIKTDKAYIEVYKRFADILNKQGKSLRDATFDDVRSFILTDKTGAENALAILYRRLNNKQVLKDPLLKAEVSEISSIVRNIPEKPMKGLRLDDIDIDNGIVQFIQSKSLFPKGVPITERLRTLFSRIMGKKDKVAGDTVFRTVDGSAFNEAQLKIFVKDFFGERAKSSDFRKGLSQYVATKYGFQSKEWATIESIGLGHKQALGKAEQRAYIKDIKLDEQFKKIRDEFIELITTDTELGSEFKGRYEKGGLTIEEIRDGYSRIVRQEPGLRLGKKGKALGKWVDGNYKLGQKFISKDTAEAIARYMIETSPRPQDVVPKSGEVFKKVATRIKPTEADTPKVEKKDTPKIVEKFKAKQEGKPAPNVEKLEYIKKQQKEKLKELKSLQAEQIKLSPNKKTYAMRVVDKKIAMHEAKIKQIDEKLGLKDTKKPIKLSELERPSKELNIKRKADKNLDDIYNFKNKISLLWGKIIQLTRSINSPKELESYSYEVNKLLREAVNLQKDLRKKGIIFDKVLPEKIIDGAFIGKYPTDMYYNLYSEGKVKDSYSAKKKKEIQQAKELYDFFDGDIEGFGKSQPSVLDYASTNWAKDAKKPITKKRTDAQRIKGEVEFQGKDIQAERNKFIDKVLKKNNLTREQLKEAKLDPNTLGEFGDGIIKLQRGEWQPADFYHENLHRLKAFANKTGNKSLSKLIDKAEDLGRTAKEFKEWKKNNPTRDMEEFLADVVGGKASRIEFTRGMIPKLKQFVKQIVSKLKTSLGVGNFNDYARILARKTQKGFATKGVKFDKTIKKREIEYESDPKVLAKEVRKNFDLLIEKIFKTSDDKETRQTASKMLQTFAKEAGIENPFDGRITRSKLSNLSSKELQGLLDVISESDIQKLRARKDIIKWMDTYRNVNDFRLKANVTNANQEFFLKQLGVEDGDIVKANIETLREYKVLLKDLGFSEGENRSWIDIGFNQGMLDANQAEMIKKFDSISTEIVRWTAPIETALRKVGQERLANRLFDHQSQEARYIGDLVDAEGRMMSHLGGEKKFNKVKNFFYLMDKERRLERQEKGYLTREEKAFIKKAFNEDGSFTDNGEGLALKELSEFNKTIKNNFLDALKQIMNDAEYENWISKNNIKWLDSTEYIHRGLSDDFKKSFSINSDATRKLVREQADKIAKTMVKQRNPNLTGSAYKKALIEVDADALDIARQYIYDRGNYMQTSISSRFLQSRMRKKLNERVVSSKLGKQIEAYETSYDSTVRKYALGMAKFTANTEYFPEYVKIKGYKTSVNFKTKLQKISEQEGGSKLKNYLSKIVEKQLGVHEDNVGFPKSERVLNDYASIIAKTQLSFPTSGLKNALVGNYQTLGAFKLRDFVRGVFDSFDSDLRAEMRKTGQTELGLRNIDNQISIFGSSSKTINNILDSIFKGGFMRPTENMNRYIAVRAAKAEQARLVGHLLANTSSRKYKNAIIRFKDFYRLTDEEISMLKKYGMGGADGLRAGIDAAKVTRRMNQIYQKMNTAAHIYTQGSTVDLFMPEVFGAKFMKPITLYKRMAYAALSNTMKNTKIAYKTGSFMRPLMMGAGAYLSGQALMGLYDKILGQTPPQENGDWWDNFVTTMWKGEFMGIMSEVMNPTNSEGFMTTPAIYNHAAMMVNNLSDLATGKAFWYQSTDAMLRGTLGFYNQGMKIYENKELASGEKSYSGKFKKYRKLYSEFSQDLKDTKSGIVMAKDEKTPYFKDFLKVFNTGTEKEFARMYVLTTIAIANDYYQEGYDSFGKRIRNINESIKEAEKTMERKMKLLNPNKAKYKSQDKIARKRAERFLMDFLTDSQRKELGSLEKEYNFKIRSFNKNKNKYFKELNIPELFEKRIDWD